MCGPAGARIEALRAQQALFNAVLAFARKVLGRHRLSNADREDLAQDVAVAAFRRRMSYRADPGGPGQWPLGDRPTGGHALPARTGPASRGSPRDDAILDTPDGALSPEERVSRRDFGDRP